MARHSARLFTKGPSTLAFFRVRFSVRDGATAQQLPLHDRVRDRARKAKEAVGRRPNCGRDNGRKKRECRRPFKGRFHGHFLRPLSRPRSQKRRWIPFSIRDFALIISAVASVSPSVILQICQQNMQMRKKNS
jgi:hypothetical protein